MTVAPEPKEALMTKLTRNQRRILEAAASRPGGAILPLPDGITLRGGVLKATLASLIKRGLATEKGKAKKPVITKPGRAAAGDEDNKAKPTGAKRHDGKAPISSIRPDSKQGRLLALLSRPEGAGITDLIETTGWQPHSVRAALTGFRKRGIAVAREKDDAGTTVYRVASG